MADLQEDVRSRKRMRKFAPLHARGASGIVEAGSNRMRHFIGSLFFLIAAMPAFAAERRPSDIACDRGKLMARPYFECLETAVRESDKLLSEAHGRALGIVDARADLAPVQKTRWRNMLEEVNGQFIRFRNFECQNVAPYEGKKGIGAFEERLICLIDKNHARAKDLAGRYGAQ